MYDDLYRDMLKCLQSTMTTPGLASNTITLFNIDDFISICIANDLNTYVVEQMIVTHGELESEVVIERLERFMSDRHDKPKARKTKPGRKDRRKVVDEDGNVYVSMTVAGQHFGVSAQAISNAVRREGKVKGKRLNYLD
jgi:hypothetical protein